MISQTVLSIIDKTEKNGDFLAYRLQIVSKAGGSWLASSDFTFRMFYTEKIHWITKCFLLSVLILAPLCSAQDEIVQKLGDEDRFLRKTDSRRAYNLDGTTATDYQQSRGYQTESQYYKTVFFVVFGLGVTLFLILLFICFKVATNAIRNHISSIPATTGIPSNIRATYTSRGGAQISYVNSAFSNIPQGLDRPPDYATVATIDAVDRNASFPQVVTGFIETPPPKYDDGPMFR